MTDEVHTYLVGVQQYPSILFWKSDKCHNMRRDSSLFFLEVRPTACSTYSAPIGKLMLVQGSQVATIGVRKCCHRRDCQPAQQPVGYAHPSCVRLPEVVRSGHGHAHPTDHSSSSASFFLFYYLPSSEINLLLPQCPHKHLSKQYTYIYEYTVLVFVSTSQVIFTNTSMPPLQFSSRRQSIDTHHSVQTRHRSKRLYEARAIKTLAAA